MKKYPALTCLIVACLLYASSGNAAGRGLQAASADKFVVAIDAGHGGRDTGAIGHFGTLEKQVVYSIARKLENFIRSDSHLQPVMVRRGDRFVGLSQRTDIARNAGADLLVSLHADAFRRGDAKGFSVFTLAHRGIRQDRLSASARKASNRAAVKVIRELRKQEPPHCRQVKKARFAVLKSQTVPSMLIETGFISNPQEEKKLASQPYQQKLAHSIYQGIREYSKAVARVRSKPLRSRKVVLASR